MCGIAGILQENPASWGEEHLKKMTNALAHRGPDGEAYWKNEDGRLQMGHRRLSILDLSEAASQPLHYMDRYTIIHNGEIYNYIELREKLAGKGYRFRTATDTEVITAAYDCWKEECLQHFDGMFAFAIWDEKEKIFFSARDRFGEKPFFYVLDREKNIFFFASEIKALKAIELGGRFNRKMLFNFLTIGYTDNPSQPWESFYEDTRKLPPASYLRISLGNGWQLEEKKYWQLDPEPDPEVITDSEAQDVFLDMLSTSVQRRLRSDVPVGTSLSGGLDSSTLAALIARENKGTSFKTFSAIFPGFEKDEEKYIDTVAAKFSLTSFKTHPSSIDLQALLGKVILQQDEPFGSAGLIPQYCVFERAKQEGVKVLLDGQGADEVLAGYHKYYKWYWQELFRRGKLGSSNELTDAKKLGIQQGFGFRNILAALFPDLATMMLERRYLLYALRSEDLSREFIHDQSREAYYTTPSIFSLNGALHFNTCVHGLEELLRYADRNSMAHGREVRLPFLDHELVEFLFSLPASFKIRQGWTKWLLRKSMDHSLPKEITWRKEKVGFEPPQQAWMQQPGMQDMVHAARKKLVNENILDKNVLNKPLQNADAYDADNADWRYLVTAPFI